MPADFVAGLAIGILVGGTIAYWLMLFLMN